MEALEDGNRFLFSIESLTQLRQRLQQLISRLTLLDLIPQDGNPSRLKIHRISLPCEPISSENLIQMAVRQVTSSLPFSVSETFTAPSTLEGSSEWVTRYAKQTGKHIRVWYHDEKRDKLSLFCSSDSTITTEEKPQRYKAILDHLSSTDAIKRKNELFFILYDESKRIDQLDISLDPKGVTPGKNMDLIRTSLKNRAVLTQRFILDFSQAEVNPILFTERSGPMTMKEFYGRIQLYCRRLDDYKVASLGLLDSTTQEWNYRLNPLYPSTLWNDIIKLTGDQGFAFHLVMNKNEVLSIPYHCINITAMGQNNLGQSIFDGLEIKNLVALVQNPDFYIITFSLETSILQSLSGFRVDFTQSKLKEKSDDTDEDEEIVSFEM